MSDTATVSDGGAAGGAAGVHRTVRLSLDTESTPSCLLYEADTRDMVVVDGTNPRGGLRLLC